MTQPGNRLEATGKAARLTRSVRRFGRQRVARSGAVMSETPWGVLFGAIIPTIMPIAPLIRDERRWRREQRPAVLREERARLEHLCKSAAGELLASKAKDACSADRLADPFYVYPGNVHEAVRMLIDDPDCSRDRLMFHALTITGE